MADRIEVENDWDLIAEQGHQCPAVTRNLCVLRGPISPQPQTVSADLDQHTTAEDASAYATWAEMVTALQPKTSNTTAMKGPRALRDGDSIRLSLPPDHDPCKVLDDAWATEGSSAHEVLKGFRAGLAFHKLGQSYDLMR